MCPNPSAGIPILYCSEFVLFHSDNLVITLASGNYESTIRASSETVQDQTA